LVFLWIIYLFHQQVRVDYLASLRDAVISYEDIYHKGIEDGITSSVFERALACEILVISSEAREYLSDYAVVPTLESYKALQTEIVEEIEAAASSKWLDLYTLKEACGFDAAALEK